MLGKGPQPTRGQSRAPPSVGHCHSVMAQDVVDSVGSWQPKISAHVSPALSEPCLSRAGSQVSLVCVCWVESGSSLQFHSVYPSTPILWILLRIWGHARPCLRAPQLCAQVLPGGWHLGQDHLLQADLFLPLAAASGHLICRLSPREPHLPQGRQAGVVSPQRVTCPLRL